MIQHMKTRSIAILILFSGFVACKNQQYATPQHTGTPNYTAPLPQGGSALQRVAHQDWPDVGSAWEARDLFLRDSIDYSIGWFDAPSSKQWFPIEGVSHEQAK